MGGGAPGGPGTRRSWARPAGGAGAPCPHWRPRDPEQLGPASRGLHAPCPHPLNPLPVLSSLCQLTKAEALLLRGDCTRQCWVQQLLQLLERLTLSGAPKLS